MGRGTRKLSEIMDLSSVERSGAPLAELLEGSLSGARQALNPADTHTPSNWTQVLGSKRGAANLAGAAEEDATLIVSSSSSKCGTCGRGADPNEETHKTVLGWGADLGEGCGVHFTHITSGYVGPDVETATRALRPDLIYIGLPSFSKS
jgi:hypothetical protein